MKVSHEALHKGMSLGTLSRQWASRPADQRFLTLDDLYAETSRLRDISQEYRIDTENIRVHIDQRAQEDAAHRREAAGFSLRRGARLRFAEVFFPACSRQGEGGAMRQGGVVGSGRG